jgi:hypothetical protein
VIAFLGENAKSAAIFSSHLSKGLTVVRFFPVLYECPAADRPWHEVIRPRPH